MTLPFYIRNKFRKPYPKVHLEVQTGYGITLIPMYEKRELDLVFDGHDSYKGHFRVLAQEPLVWGVGNVADTKFHEGIVLLAVLPFLCNFRKFAIGGIEKIDRQWEVLFTGTSIGNIQAAVQAGRDYQFYQKV